MIILRILVYPFVLSLIVVSYSYHAVRNSIMFLIHGGEWITYAKSDKVTMKEIFEELKQGMSEK